MPLGTTVGGRLKDASAAQPSTRCRPQRHLLTSHPGSNLNSGKQFVRQTTAAVGGRLKDASGDDSGLMVEPPIFDNANFERPEHEGRGEIGRQTYIGLTRTQCAIK